MSLVILSASREKRDKSQVWLVALLLSLTLRIGKSALHLYLQDAFSIELVYLFLGLNFFIGPLLYGYLRSLNRAPGNKVYLHLVPGVAVMLSGLLLPAELWEWIYAMLIVQTVLYLGYAWRQIDKFLSFQNVLISWKNHVFLGVTGISLSYFLVVLLSLNQYTLPVLTYAVLLYLMTLYLMRSSDIKKLLLLEEKYKHTKLSDSQRIAIMTELDRLMENQQLYIRSDLTLKQVSEMVKMPVSYISQAINLQLSQNFNEWVNEKRIRDICLKLKSECGKELTIKEVAYAHGFNSLSSFHQAFKNNTGMTPSAFKKQV
jgi:AraC-like DNA-binding protein